MNLDSSRLNRYGRRVTLLPAERRLLEAVAAEHGLTPSAVLSRSRYPRVAFARHHFIAVLRWTTFMSYPDIGALVGGLDHTTIIAAEHHYDRVLNGDEDRARTWQRAALARKAEHRLWGCPLHAASSVHVPLGREPRVRYCHAMAAAGSGECGARLAPLANAAAPAAPSA